MIGVGTTSVTSRRPRPTRTAPDRPSRSPRTILTVAVDQKQAEKLIFAARNGELAFALLTEDSKVADEPGRHRERHHARDLPEPPVTAIVEPDAGAAAPSCRRCCTARRRSATMEELDEHIRRSPHEFAVVIGPSIAAEDAADAGRSGPGSTGPTSA